MATHDQANNIHDPDSGIGFDMRNAQLYNDSDDEEENIDARHRPRPYNHKTDTQCNCSYILLILLILAIGSLIGYSLGSAFSAAPKQNEFAPITNAPTKLHKNTPFPTRKDPFHNRNKKHKSIIDIFAEEPTPKPEHAAYPGNAVINNKNWTDVDGKLIHAHGGQIYEYKNVFYLIGTTQKVQPGWLSEGINCYSSADLVHWKFENEIFHNTSIVVADHHPPVYPPWRIERPKVLYNQKNDKFVLWWHLDTAGFSLTSVGVAQSGTICGNYAFVSCFEPDGKPSYDMGLFQDGDKAYLVRSVSNSYAGISRLSDDYLSTSAAGISSKGPKMEGVTIFEWDTYYLLGSHLTGWAPNAAELCTTKNAESQGLDTAVWDNMANNACPNPTTSSTTYGSQSTYVVRLEDTANKKYVFMAMFDIWDNPNVGDATYIWLPVQFQTGNKSESFPSIPYHDTWTVNDYAVDMP